MVIQQSNLKDSSINHSWFLLDQVTLQNNYPTTREKSIKFSNYDALYDRRHMDMQISKVQYMKTLSIQEQYNYIPLCKTEKTNLILACSDIPPSYDTG